ncbi:hypothetical protein PGTUg99_008854 [Puccinia graminis f. sp. tritici]|uniref:DUF6589 domain-containing protein n=1 Tax=Puccinia graminis f. sp. tritici TaxID=56615 RepID=A0A5B0NWA5_PUCGR|nr:hypothetical protein PGTUg99_008854 [Puccinia graminis f. sp. tritici]
METNSHATDNGYGQNPTSEQEKVLYICKELTRLKMTPKEFMMGLLTKSHTDLKYRRRTWATDYGWTSTIDLVEAIARKFDKTAESSARWAQFILAEAIRISHGQSPPRGSYPSGSWQSACTVGPGFFGEAAKEERRLRLTNQDTPFLYKFILGTMSNLTHEDEDACPTADELDQTSPLEEAEVDDSALIEEQEVTQMDSEGNAVSSPDQLKNKASDTLPTSGMQIPKPTLREGMSYYEGFDYSAGENTLAAKEERYRYIASVVCSMVTFARNRRQNGLQLMNAIRFDSCGLSETINEHLHYIGLTSSRKTAVQALRSLARHAQASVVRSMSITQDIAPILCIDNLDMEERVQMAMVGKQTRMFHGTWGYLHIPDPTLLKSLKLDELSLKAYHDSLRKVNSMVINADTFLPTDRPEDDYEQIWKSQIGHVMLKYVAKPTDRKHMTRLEPLPVEQISHHPPTVHMLKLMDESDNSAEGIGQVMGALQRQSGLDPEEFFGRLQLVEGDLGTCQIFNAIRTLRMPSEHDDHSYDNVNFTLGAAHTLWNIAYTILNYHFGDSKKMDDFGVWRYLDALGIPPEKVIQKKDFTKMLQYMEQVHEATLWQCLRTVMGIENDVVEEDIPVIKTEEWNQIVEECYQRFCSPDARVNAQDNPQLNNLLVRMQDFSTVVEANRAMKGGDVGRLINIWKMWSVMTQSLPGLTHYSAYLPRLILFITQILPPDMGKLIRNTLLVSPSGRPNHFVAKDFFLETYNYWLKFFYCRGGIGTQVERLKALYSSNIPLLRGMFHSLRTDSGVKHIQQSHTALLKHRSLERFAQMAQNNDILHVQGKDRGTISTKSIPDTYLQGLKCLQEEVIGKKVELGRFTLHLPLYDDQENIPLSEDDSNSSIGSSPGPQPDLPSDTETNNTDTPI